MRTEILQKFVNPKGKIYGHYIIGDKVNNFSIIYTLINLYKGKFEKDYK